jgi:hypothetical protein
MDSRISSASRPDIVLVESSVRPTPTPARVSFGQVLAAGAGGLVQGAELAASHLPGAPIAAAAIRGGSSLMSLALPSVGNASVTAVAEGPSSAGVGLSSVSGGLSMPVGSTAGASALGTTGAAGDPTGGIDASLQQSAQLSMYYLQVQQEVDAQNRSFTALSNVLKTQHDSAKAAIQNIHS